MAYADPNLTHNPATSTIAPAAWGDVVRDDLDWLSTSKPSCYANAAAAQATTNLAWTKIALGGETWDVGSCHSTVTNNSRLTVPTGGAGKYLIVAQASWAASATNTRHARINVNNALVIAQVVSVPSGYGHLVIVTAMAALAAGDYVELEQYQDSGGSLNTGSPLPSLSFMWMGV